MEIPGSIRRTTQKDVAQALWLGQSTISMALSNDPRIPKMHAAEIQKKAKELGYRPEPMLTALAHYRKSRKGKPVQAVVAWLNVWSDPKKLRKLREFDKYWRGATACAEKFGYRLEEFALSEMSPTRLEKVLLTKNIQGLLIAPQGGFEVDWKEFQWERFSVVRLGRLNSEPNVHIVTSDQVTDAMLAFNEIHKRGYKRIGFVGSHKQNRTFGAGFLWAQTQLPLRSRLRPFFFEDDDNAQTAFTAWLDQMKPDAIFTTEPHLPLMLKQEGYRVPQDIAVAATTLLDTPITAGIDQKPEEIGRVAMLSVISLINDHDRGVPLNPREILIKGSWKDGPSLPLRT